MPKTSNELAALLKLIGFSVEKTGRHDYYHKYGYRYRIKYKQHIATILTHSVFIHNTMAKDPILPETREISFATYYERAVRLVEEYKDDTRKPSS